MTAEQRLRSALEKIITATECCKEDAIINDLRNMCKEALALPPSSEGRLFMKELKLGEIRGLLPDKDNRIGGEDCTCAAWCYLECACGSSWENYSTHNRLIDNLSNKNLLDYVEAVVCPTCDGTGSVIGTSDSVHVCLSCNGSGAVIRVKEGK